MAFDASSTRVEPESLLQRRYTLTHNDVTRNLTLTVGDAFNDDQTSIWYTRLLRDEVLAEWREDGLHVFCQVSAKEAWWIRWAAPPSFGRVSSKVTVGVRYVALRRERATGDVSRVV